MEAAATLKTAAAMGIAALMGTAAEASPAAAGGICARDAAMIEGAGMSTEGSAITADRCAAPESAC